MYRLQSIPGIRQAVAIVSGSGSRAEGWAEARQRSEVSSPDCPLFPERGVCGAVAGRSTVAGACYILHLRESNPRGVEERTERRLARGSV